MKKTVSMVAAGAVVAVGAWLLHAPEPEAEPARAEAALPSTQVVDAKPEPLPAACRFSVGDTMAYSVDVRSTLEASIPGVTTKTPFELQLQARVGFEVLTAGDTSAVLVGKFDQFQGRGALGLETAAMTAPFLVEVQTNCQLLQFARHESMPQGAARNQQALLWDTQFRVGGPSELRLQNGNGTAVATLTQVDRSQVRRTLQRYEALWDTNEPGPAYGQLGVVLGRGPWFERLETTERFTAATRRSESTLTLARTTTGAAFTTAERDRSHYVWGNLLPFAQANLVKRPFTSFDAKRQQAVANVPPEQVLADFVDRVERGVGVQSTWPDLSAFFEVHPEQVRPTVKKYLAGEVPEGAAADFFLALGKTRNDEARTVLLELKRDESLAAMDRTRAMFALVVRDDVHDDFARELHADFRSHVAKGTKQGVFLATESILALGTLAGSHDDPKVTAVTTQALSSELQSVAEPQLTKAVLSAIGNTGEPALLPDVQRFTQAAERRTREAATNALLRMPPSTSETMELEWLRRETHPWVKQKLYSVIWQQHLNLNVPASRELVQQGLNDLKKERSQLTRRDIIRFVSKSEAAKDPEVRRALVDQAKLERSRHTKLLNEFTSILTPDEVAEVLR